ncbi:MAG: DUF4360 domain-containing protein [Bdellovibrionaceae bacterium]|nr:DUF4360 domain-containing protein [Pseudobdellovibrionaceae bacterium]
MKIAARTLGLLLPLALSAPAWAATAAEIIDVSQIQSGGNGCPGGGPLEVYQSSFSGRVMIFLPEMNVDVSSKRIDRKACAISLAVAMPAGKRLVIGEPAVFGAADLAEGASAIAAAEVFTAGSTGPKVDSKIGAKTDEHVEYYYDRVEDVVRTECGADVNVRANVSLLGNKGSSAQGGSATLEGTALTLQLEDCGQ